MRIRVLGRLKARLASLRGRLAPGPIVLLYHRVAHIEHDPHLLAVAPEHFDEHLLALRRHFRVVFLSELSRRIAAGDRLGPAVALTFDDGYADNAEEALPRLVRHGLPATFYLSSGFVGTTRECVHDELERLLLLPTRCPDNLHLTLGGMQFSWAMQSDCARDRPAATDDSWSVEARSDPTPRHRAHREIFALLRAAPEAVREEALQQLRSQCGDPGPARPSHRAMSWDQARQMAVSRLADLGAHTVRHPWLSGLPLNEQRGEILESKRAIEGQLGRPVASFAYPYGTRQSYTAETVGLVKELGFTYACSNFRERIGSRTDMLQIPRFVVRDWDGDEFLRQLRAGRL